MAWKLPIVRRSSHEKVLQLVEARHAAERAALQAAHDQLQAAHDQARAALQAAHDQLQAAHDQERAALQAAHDQERADKLEVMADRDRLLAHTERLAAEIEALRERAAQRDVFEKIAGDYRAECERLSAAETQLLKVLGAGSATQFQVEFARLRDRADQRDLFESILTDFRAECARLGAAETTLIQLIGSLSGELLRSPECGHLESRSLLRRLLAPDTAMIGTLPRSGTWMLKYFLHFLDCYCRSEEEPSISALYQDVTSASHYYLQFDAPHLPQRLAISHWMCPGAFDLSGKKSATLTELLGVLNCVDYHRECDAAHEAFQPGSHHARIIYVYRNPLDVYRSYADIYERRIVSRDRKPYPFNPMVPFGQTLMNSESERPFEYFIENFAESGFTEYFIAHFMSYLLVRDAYPMRVTIVRYEDMMANRAASLKQILDAAGIGFRRNERFDRAFSKALSATEISRMKDYEAKLGHALSGAETFYGEGNPTHLSVKKRDWRTIFKQSHIEYLRKRISETEPRILDYLPELFANKPLA